MKIVDTHLPSEYLNHVAAFGVRRLEPMNSICKICPATCPCFSNREFYAWRGAIQIMTKKKICGVYVWEHVPTGMCYVGSSVDCEFRKKRHQKCGGHFHRRATELGWENFAFRILEECAPETRLKLERDWIEKMDSVHPRGFNIQKDPVRAWNYVFTDEARAAQSARLKIIKGTPEARAAQSARAKMQFNTPEAREEISTRFKNFLSNPEARKANSDRQKAYYSTPEARAAQSAKAKMQFNTPEARKANSERTKLRFSNPEERKLQSERMKRINGTPESRKANSARRKAYFAANKNPLCKAVNQYTEEGKFVSTFESSKSAAEAMGVRATSISRSLRKGSRCGGFYWRFAGEAAREGRGA